jgi:hypothetical protein
MSLRTSSFALLVLALLGACVPAATPTLVSPPRAGADLSGIRAYLLEKIAAMEAAAADLQSSSSRYYELAEAFSFDYSALWAARPAETAQALVEAKSAWMIASPLYEQMEGIVAGVPSLSRYDVILDAGASGAEDPDNAAPYDLALSDGRLLERPGNLFGVLESALWGTESAFNALAADLDSSGALDFGESLPDAHVLVAAADALVAYSGELASSAQDWQPSESDAFTALVVMIPTMNEYFNSWKNSRFVSGPDSTQRDFVAISRLSDIQDILGGLQIVYQGVKPLVASADADQAARIEGSLADLKTYVSGIHAQETNGKRFSAEEADILGAEAQDRATALTGQIAQIAAQLEIKIEG